MQARIRVFTVTILVLLATGVLDANGECPTPLDTQDGGVTGGADEPVAKTAERVGDGMPARSSIRRQALKLFGASPALFVENCGQWSDRSIRFVHDGAFANVAITDAGVTFQTIRNVRREDEGAHGTVAACRQACRQAWRGNRLASEDTDMRVLQFSSSCLGAGTVRPAGLKRAPALFNYNVGDQANWRENVPSYELVAYRGLYEGIDLHMWGMRSHLKYEFHVAPGADYQQIVVRYAGVEGLSIADDGSLTVDLGSDWPTMRDDAPYIYQQIAGRRVEIPGRFIMLDDRTCAFELTGPVDADHALVIDPNLAWSTYLGGMDADLVGGISVDAAGNVYVTGETASAGWVSGGYDTSPNGTDAYVVKLTSEGNHVWSTYLGGDGSETWLGGIVVDPMGGIYVTGMTNSAGWVSGGFDTTSNGPAFVAKLTSAGGHDWSTYLGGADGGVYGIAADSAGGVYVTGSTRTAGWVNGGFDASYNGGEFDAFVTKLSAAAGHDWSTYLGGAGYDGFSGDIAVDGMGAVYVTGITDSTGWVSGGFDTTYNGGLSDTFVIRLTAAGEHNWSTYLGGTETETAYGIAVDGAGDVYVTGGTNSSGWVSGGFDTTIDDADAFVVKLTGAGTHSWSTYVGGSGSENGKDISVDAAGRVYVAGQSKSVNWARRGFDTIHDGGWDGFVASMTDGGACVWSSYLGGAEDEDVDSMVAAPGGVYVAGNTFSVGWVAGGFDTSYGGSFDAFVAKITDDKSPAVLHDWNGDGIVSIVGDVPPFVNCVYFGTCPCGVDPMAVSDCNGDDILSLIGDVPCFVDCVYFGTCPE